MAIDPSLRGHLSRTPGVPSLTGPSVTTLATTQESPAGHIDRRGSALEQRVPKG